jgi:hypothetical protein
MSRLQITNSEGPDLYSRNVWSAPKGTRVFSMRKHGIVYSLTAVLNG